jgi:hypothetical protein
MPGGEDIHTMIERGDSTALRRMAGDAPKQEARMFLALLAEMIDRQREENVQLKMTA